MTPPRFIKNKSALCLIPTALIVRFESANRRRQMVPTLAAAEERRVEQLDAAMLPTDGPGGGGREQQGEVHPHSLLINGRPTGNVSSKQDRGLFLWPVWRLPVTLVVTPVVAPVVTAVSSCSQTLLFHRRADVQMRSAGQRPAVHPELRNSLQTSTCLP